MIHKHEKTRHEKSREEQLADEVLALVERFHEPSKDRHAERAASHDSRSPRPSEALVLALFAYQVLSRRKHSDARHIPAENVRDGIRRAFVLRHR